MNFLHLSYLPGIILAALALFFIVVVLERRFFRLVKTYWFYKRSLFSYLSSFFFLAGMTVLLLSLMDARGPEQRIKTPVPKERTIILIDTSASMLAEDVKPSRLQKAALLGKHFARKASGHQIAVVAFAELQKKIVPFTNDLDLIDARLDSLKSLRNQYGSSALTIAIQESVQYFKEGGEEARGNILVLTDGEQTSAGIKLKIPKEVNVALVGIGTTQGGRIPMDDGRGFRFGYKKNVGVDVITKLNESFFKNTAADLPSAKYWLANSYTLPSEEIVEFFRTQQMEGLDEQDMVIRPVMMEWLVVPAIIALIISYLFKFIRVFTLSLLLLLVVPAGSRAEEAQLTPELQSRLQHLSQGSLNKLEKLKLADDLYRAGAKPEALELYGENLSVDRMDPEVPAEAYMNYGTALLDNKEEQKGLSVYELVDKSLGKDNPKAQELKDIMDKNVVTHFKVKKEQKKKEQEKKEQEAKENKDSQNQGQGGNDKKDQDGKSQQNQSGQGQQMKDPSKPGKPEDQDKKDQSGKQDKDQEGEDKDQQGKDKEGKDQEGKDKEQGDQGEKKENKNGEGEGEKPKHKRVKVDPKLRQLVDDDRSLQERFLENETRDLNKRKDRKSKDW